MDIKVELQNFKAINIDEIVRNNGQLPDNIRNSIILYNKALESLKSGSEDIAVIELKKAVSMNPRFFEAFNLLGVCYSYIGDNEKAAEMFDKVIKAEPNSVLAMNFVQRMGLGDTMQTQKGKPAGKAAERPVPGEPLKRVRTAKEPLKPLKMNKIALANILRIGAGFAAGVLLTAIFFMSFPAQKADVTPEPATQAAADSTGAQAANTAELAQLREKYELLQKDRDSAMRQADYLKSVIKLYDADAMARDRKYGSAADMLLLLKTVNFTDKDKQKYDSLCETVMPLAAKSAYDQGYKLYNQRKYQDSIKSFEKVQLYYPQYARMDAALYYMGRSCQALQDSRSAVALYQKLLNEYPGSIYAKSAKSRINELTKIP